MVDIAVTTRTRTWPAVLTLLILAPVVTEVISGATTLATLFVLLPEIGTYGVIALLARAAVRGRGLGWAALLTLAIAWAIAEEFLIIQTSITPLIGISPANTYGGRALGVSWVFMVWALGFESVWPVLIGVQLTELIFPGRRADPWIGRRGAIIAGLLFVICALVAWFSWTHIGEQRHSGHSYTPWSGWFILAALAIALLVTLALRRRGTTPGLTAHDRRTPPPLVVGAIAAVLALAWMTLVLFAYGEFRAVPVPLCYLGAAVVIALALLLFPRWAASVSWRDGHRLAAVSGVLLATMVYGLWIGSGPSSVPQLVFQAVVDLVVLALIVRTGLRLRRD